MASFTCDACGSELSSSSNLKRHQEHVHGNKQSCCPECFKSFGRHDHFLRHWRKFHDAANLPRSDHVLDLLPSYDDRGRVTASEWVSEGAAVSNPSTSHFAPDKTCILQPPCPPFMIQVVENLKRKFRDTRMASFMYLCPVHRLHHIPILRARQPLDEAEYIQQYVPTIKCLDCIDEYLLVPSSSVLGIAEDHFGSSEHIRQVKLRRVADSGILQEAFNRMLMVDCWFPSPQRTLVADLITREKSLSGLEAELSIGHGETLVISAVKKYTTEILQVLLEEKLDASSVDQRGRSALHWACELGDFDKAELLIEHGLQLHARDARCTTPLDLAVRTRGVVSTVALVLVEAKAESIKSPLHSITPLAIACRCNHDGVVREVMERGADVNDTGSSSPLEMALRWGDYSLVLLLLERGAKLQSISGLDLVLLQKGQHGDNTGSTPLYRDADEKIAILERFGLSLKSMRANEWQAEY